jgi:hypothetical protein
MLALLVLGGLSWPACPQAGGMTGWRLAEDLAPTRDERAAHLMPAPREISRKELWLREKAFRPPAHSGSADLALKARGKEPARKSLPAQADAEARLAEPMSPVGTRVQPIVTLFNLWNREALPLLAGRPWTRPFQLFLRDHYTKEATFADTRLATVLASAALHFHSTRIDVVSGYRSPKYNLMLRKKGHQVARESQHTQGTAVDFRVRGASTEALREFVRSLRLGGVGYYPRTRFIHADTGKVRFWEGS